MAFSHADSSPLHPAGEPDRDDLHAAAFEFGWQSRLQYGRTAATEQLATEELSFEKAEPELAKIWKQREESRGDRHPWQAARETARDAWNQVYDALAGDTSAKTKTNG